MSGSVINKTVIRREIIHINRIYSETASRKKLILLVSDNSMEAVSLYCYHMKKRNTVFFVGNTKKAPDIAALIDHFMPDEIFLDRKKMRDVESEPALYEEIEENYQTGSPYYQYVRLQRRQEIKDVLYDDLALLMVTSGSVGNGKIVALSYDNLRSNAQAIIESLEIDENDRAGVMLPVSYVYGLSVVNSHLLADAELLLPQGNMFQSGYWDFLEECRVTSFCGVPYTYEILDYLRILSRPWKELRLLTQAGGAMSREMKQKLLEWICDRRQRGITTHLAIMYGQTEANYRGANVYLGYVKERSDLTENADVWRQNTDLLDTGDVGKLDEEGYLYITGRKKRFIKCNGIRISLDELERSIEIKWAVPVVCVSRVSDEQILLFIRIQDFRNIDIMELTDYLRQLGIRKEQCRIRKIPAFHYCDNGKLDYASFK